MFGQGDEDNNPSFGWGFSDPISSTRAQKRNFFDAGSRFGFRNYEQKQEKYDIQALFEPKADQPNVRVDYDDIIKEQTSKKKQMDKNDSRFYNKSENNSPVKSNKTLLSKANNDLDTVSNTREAEAFIKKNNSYRVEQEEDLIGFPILHQNYMDDFSSSYLFQDLYQEEKYEAPDLNCLVSLTLEAGSSSLSVKFPSNELKVTKLLPTFL